MKPRRRLAAIQQLPENILSLVGSRLTGRSFAHFALCLDLPRTLKRIEGPRERLTIREWDYGTPSPSLDLEADCCGWSQCCRTHPSFRALPIAVRRQIRWRTCCFSEESHFGEASVWLDLGGLRRVSLSYDPAGSNEALATQAARLTGVKELVLHVSTSDCPFWVLLMPRLQRLRVMIIGEARFANRRPSVLDRTFQFIERHPTLQSLDVNGRTDGDLERILVSKYVQLLEELNITSNGDGMEVPPPLTRWVSNRKKIGPIVCRIHWGGNGVGTATCHDYFDGVRSRMTALSNSARRCKMNMAQFFGESENVMPFSFNKQCFEVFEVLVSSKLRQDRLEEDVLDFFFNRDIVRLVQETRLSNGKISDHAKEVARQYAGRRVSTVGKYESKVVSILPGFEAPNDIRAIAEVIVRERIGEGVGVIDQHRRKKRHLPSWKYGDPVNDLEDLIKFRPHLRRRKRKWLIETNISMLFSFDPQFPHRDPSGWQRDLRFFCKA